MLNETCLLVTLKIGMPPQSRKARHASEEVEVKYKTARRQAKVSKNLYSRKDISSLQKCMTKARALFNELSLPYDEGRRIIASESYFEFTQQMAGVAMEFDSKKVKFIDEHHITLMRAEQELGGLFNEDDYPTTEELDRRMYFTVESNVIPPITAFDELAGLTPEAIEELKAQAIAGQQKKVEDALQDLFTRLFSSLNKAAVKLSDEDAIFRDTLIGNINGALAAIETLNLTNNEKLIALAEEVKSILEGVTPEELRKDKDLRKQTAADTKDLLNKMGEFF